MLSKGCKTVRIGRMSLPGTFLQTKESDHCRRLAASIQQVGLVNLPLVRASDNLVICGITRVAACASLGWEAVECRMVDAGDSEVLLLRDHARMARLHLTMGQQADLALAARDRAYEAARASSPLALKEDANVAVGEVIGLAPRTISNRKSRKVKADRDKIGSPEEIDFGWFQLFGLEMTPAFKERVTQVEVGMRTAIRNSTHARNETLAMKRSRSIPQSEVVALLASQDAALKRLEDSRVWGLCPWCKGCDGLCGTCAACSGNAYITHLQSRSVPRELLRTDILMVAVGGVYRPADSYLEPGIFVPDADGVF